jgi:MurNAc alpha-1-phosphate uridylyltransferase
MNTQLVILAGGMATRLGSLSESQAKSMILVGNKPFLENQIDMLRNNGVRNILLCLGHLSQQIIDYFGDGKQYGVDITYIVEDKPLGTAGALKNAEHLLDKVFMTLYGDSYLFLDFEKVMERFIQAQKPGLMTVYRNNGLYDKSNTAIDVFGYVTKYDKYSKGGLEYIDYGLNVFQKSVLKLIPSHEFCSLEMVFKKLIEIRELVAYEVKDRFYEIGSLAGLNEFKNFMSSEIK